MSDEKLLAMCKTIENMMRQEDVAGFVVLFNAPDQFETFTRIDPTFSIAKFEQGRRGLAIRLNSKGYVGTADEKHAALEATASMLAGLGEIAGRNAVAFLSCLNAMQDQLPGMTQTPLYRTDDKP